MDKRPPEKVTIITVQAPPNAMDNTQADVYIKFNVEKPTADAEFDEGTVYIDGSATAFIVQEGINEFSETMPTPSTYKVCTRYLDPIDDCEEGNF